MFIMSNTKLASSVFAIFLSGSMLAATPAHSSNPELYFYPKAKWIVEQSSAGSPDVKTCSIKNKLNNGYVIEISGSSNGFETISLDLRQSVFQENFKYEVQYNLPGVSRAIVTSKANSSHQIASTISGHDEFSKQLSSSGTLDIQIRDNNFRVYLTGLKASLPAFNDCVNPQPAFASDGKPEIAGDNEHASALSEKPTSSTLNTENVISASVRALPPEAIAVQAPPTKKPEVSKKPKLQERERFTEALAKEINDSDAEALTSGSYSFTQNEEKEIVTATTPETITAAQEEVMLIQDLSLIHI